jgi:DNA polymerase III epsilon subunit-like protein
MIVVDVETTGTNPYKHCIVSIGAVEFENPSNTFYRECQIFEGAEIDLESMKVNGFSIDEIKDPTKKTLEQVMNEFINWCSSFYNKTLIAFNAGFDSSFLEQSCKRYNIYWQFGFRTIDIHTVCYVDMMNKNVEIPIKYGASAVYANKTFEYCGLPREPEPHNALNGAKYETETMHRILNGKSVYPEFLSYKIPNYLMKTKQASLF